MGELFCGRRENSTARNKKDVHTTTCGAFAELDSMQFLPRDASGAVIRRVYAPGEEDRVEADYDRHVKGQQGAGASKPCYNFQRGNCRYGSSCQYAHIGGQDNFFLGYGPQGGPGGFIGHRGGRGGGGGRGGNFNNKRRNEPHEGDAGEGQDRPRSKMKKPSGMVEQKLPDVEPQIALAKQILARLGDFTALTEDDDLLQNIRTLAEIFVDVGDLKLFPEEISDVFVKCMSSLSVQSTIVSTLLSLIYRRDASFPAIVVRKLGDGFINALKQNNINVAKVLLRSMAALTCSHCLVAEGQGSVLSLLETLLARVEMDWKLAKSASDISVEGKVAMYLLASTIPWLVSELTAGKVGTKFAAKLLPILQRFQDEYKSVYDLGGSCALFHAYAATVDDDGNIMSVQDKAALCDGPEGSACWDTLWAAVHFALESLQKAKAKDFSKPSCMLTPWDGLQEDLSTELVGEEWDGSTRSNILTLSGDLAGILHQIFVDAPTEIFFNAPSSAVSQFKLASTSSSTQSSTSIATWLSPIFCIYDGMTSPASVQCAAGTTALERHILSEYYRDIMYFFDPVINEDGTRCGSIELMCAHLNAVAKMRSAQEPVVELESLLAETIFQKLVQTPINPTQTALLFRIVLELCQKSTLFANAVALGTHSAFQMLSEMDTASVRELAAWFALHQLNSNFSWPFWNSWIDMCMEDPVDGSRILFCKIVVDKMGRAVNHDVLTKVLPDTLHELLPGDSMPKCTSLASAKFAPILRKLRKLIENREEPEIITEWLDKPDMEIDAETHADETWRAPLLLQVILMIAGDVPSSLTNLVERYMDPLRTHSASEQSELALVSCLGECLNHEPGYFNQSLDILLRRSIITVSAAAKWATNAENLSFLALHTWPYKNIELVVNRALDIARAAVAKRRDIGEDMPFDKTTDTLPISTFLLAVKEKPAVKDEDIGDAGDEANMDEEEDYETQNINAATEAVVAALRSVRAVYATIICNLASYSANDAATEAWKTSAASLARYICSSYDFSEKNFLQVEEVAVVLTDKAVVSSFFTEAKQNDSDAPVGGIEKVYNIFLE